MPQRKVEHSKAGMTRQPLARFRARDRGSHEGSSRLNHWLPGRQPYSKVVQCTADFHDQVADARLSEAAGVVDNTAALDAAVDVLDADAATRDASIGGFLAAREGSAAGLAGWHDDLDLIECERQEAEVLEQPTARG